MCAGNPTGGEGSYVPTPGRVIAAVNGAALGAGLGLMGACDIMLAAENAVFGMPEIDVGLAGGAACACSARTASARPASPSAAPPPSRSCWKPGVLEAGLPPAGPVGIVSQSGNLGSFALLLARERGMGVSRFLTTGNECDADVAGGIAWLAACRS